MGPIVATEIYGKITWLGGVKSQEMNIRSAPVDEIKVSYAGQEGVVHGGVTRASCVRVKPLYPEGTEIRNVRQFSILSAEEMAATAAQMGLERLEPEWLGASIVVEGIEDFTHLPPSSRLQAPSGAALVVDMLNQPCQYPAQEIERDLPGQSRGYVRAANGRRGVTAWVEREGVLRLGDELRLFVPTQRPWAPFETVVPRPL